MVPELPTGVVSFLMTDVEASTAIWRDSPHAAAAMARQAELIGAAVAKHGGVRPADQGEGDSAFAAFPRPGDAIAAAFDAQRALAAERWPEGAVIRVRMAVHTGEAELRDERNYGGLALIRCARLRALAQGGQVLVSSTAAALAGERLPEGVSLLELDTVPIAGFASPERVSQLRHPDLPGALASLKRQLSALPVWPTPLVGREQERRELAALFDEQRLVTVTGAGGSGKTRLALAVAEDLRDRFAGGVAWVELARLASPEQVAGAVVAACGAHEVPGVPALDVLVRHLADRELLLVLDNCEHLLGACAELADAALRAGSRVRLLATSREPLGALGESSWRIPSLTLPAEGERDPERLAESDAVRLFVARAHSALAEFRLDAASAPLVARICRRLDGIPLALELAAARVRALSLERLADGLDDRFRLLTGGARTAVARQRTLLASVEWSHDLLDEEERALFRRLAVFAAPFGLEAAEAVAADDDLDALSVFDLLAHLVDKSLVLHAGDRYRLLETLRQYAIERADDAGELAELRDRHLAWFERRAGAWRFYRDLVTPSVVAEVAAEAQDLVAAAEWCAGRQGRLPLEIAHALSVHWQARDAHEEARKGGGQLLGLLEVGSRAWLEALAPLAHSLVLAGETGWIAPAHAALLAAGGALDPVTRGWLDVALFLPAAFLGDREARDVLRRAAEVGREAGNRLLEANPKADLCLSLSTNGDPAGARPLLAWLERHVARDSLLGFYLIQMSRAWLAAYDGDFTSARRFVEPALVHRGPRIGALGFAGSIGLWTRDLDLLRRAHAGCDGLASLGALEGLRDSLAAFALLLEDDLDAAAKSLDRAAEGFFLGSIKHWVRALRAEVAFSLGDAAGAAARTVELESQLAGVELPYVRSAVDLLAAHLARGRGDRLSAKSLGHACLANVVAHETPLVITDALEVLALLSADRGELDEAGRLLGAASAFRERTGYRWQPHHHRCAIEELRPRLPELALAEGSALELAEAADYVQRGRGERGRPDHGWESLTPSEQRVVELVAEGLPNAAIAKQLFVSLATVKTHLVHVYGKLELKTRAELAAAATARRLGQGGA